MRMCVLNTTVQFKFVHDNLQSIVFRVADVNNRPRPVHVYESRTTISDSSGCWAGVEGWLWSQV